MTDGDAGGYRRRGGRFRYRRQDAPNFAHGAAPYRRLAAYRAHRTNGRLQDATHPPPHRPISKTHFGGAT